MAGTAERRPVDRSGVQDDAHGGGISPTVLGATDRIREALQEHGCQPRGSNVRFRARCPVHGSRGGTLAVSQGRCGALVKCHAQCETADVLAAIGLSWADLYDEARAGPSRPWRTSPRRTSPPAPAEQAGRVIVRAVTIMLTAEAQKAAAFLRPALTPAERVEQAEWACRRDADTHYWRTLARWAALACDERYMRQALRDYQAWRGRRGDRPTHEQFMVLLTRAEDLERAR